MESIHGAALELHCRRVAGWATQAAQAIACPPNELAALEAAALAHHGSPLVSDGNSLDRLVSDLHIQTTNGRDPARAGVLQWAAILQAFSGYVTPDARAEELASVLEWADAFDEQFELEGMDPASSEEPYATREPLRLADAAAVLRAGAALPVFPTVAQRAIRLLLSDDVGLDQVESVVRADQALATELLKAANTAITGTRQPITTLHHAVSQIGIDSATRIICATCLTPMYASRQLHRLWTHSITAALTAEEFALASQRVAPAEAFLAGLIHDIGRLAFSLLSSEFQVRSQRLSEYGCPVLLIERALAGTNHAEMGAELLRSWAVPASIAEAVRWHHDPEHESAPALAAILYATEFQTMSDEDLPSWSRLRHALQMVNLPMDFALRSHEPSAPSLACLRPADWS